MPSLSEVASVMSALTDEAVERQISALSGEVRRLRLLLNTPEILDFRKAVSLEAAHQRERWGSEHDEGKSDADWFWLIGYLAGKALHTPIGKDGPEDDVVEKRLHRIITVGAACANWHSAVLGGSGKSMRPGIEDPEES